MRAAEQRARAPRCGLLAVAVAGLLTAALAAGCATSRTMDPYRLSFDSLQAPRGDVTVRRSQIIDTSTEQPLSFQGLLARLERADVIHVGESHDHREHHQLQARIIEGLAAAGPLVVGLEMLPTSVQPTLDAWVAGELTEKQFVQQVEWYEHWGFDYRYYRPIFQIARQQGLRLIGLNVPGDVVRQVGRKGLEALPPEKRSQIPPEIWLGSAAHRELFTAMISPGEQDGDERHHHKGMLHRLYQAQSVWDEAMAAAVIEARAAARPAPRVVVLAGNGHVVYGLGIAMRLSRRAPQLQQAIVVALTVPRGGEREVSRQLAHYLIGTAPEGPQQRYPMLGVKLKADGGAVVVERFGFHSSTARDAGVKKGDRIVAADGEQLGGVFDLQWLLQQKDWGDTIVLDIDRAGKRLRIPVRLEHARKGT